MKLVPDRRKTKARAKETVKKRENGRKRKGKVGGTERDQISYVYSVYSNSTLLVFLKESEFDPFYIFFD